MVTLARRHPLQRLSSPSRSISALVHLAGLVSFFGSFHFLRSFPNEISEAYGWHFQYLTIIGLSLATVTFFVGFLADLTLSSRLFLIKNACTMASAPLEVLISVLYWGICAYDKDLVVPPHMRLDLFTDFGFHLFPSILLLIDILLLSPPWSLGALSAVGIPASLAVGYWFWLEQCYSRNGFYPYPLMNVMGTAERVVLYTLSAGMMAACTLGLVWVYGYVNGVEEEEAKAKVKAKVK